MIERFDAYLTPTEARNRAASVDGGRAWSEGDKQHATYVYLGQDAEVAGDLGKAAELYSKALAIRRYELSNADAHFDLARVAYKRAVRAESGDPASGGARRNEIIAAKLEVIEHLARFLTWVEQELSGDTPWGLTPEARKERLQIRSDALWILRRVAGEIEAIPPRNITQ